MPILQVFSDPGNRHVGPASCGKSPTEQAPQRLCIDETPHTRRELRPTGDQASDPTKSSQTERGGAYPKDSLRTEIHPQIGELIDGGRKAIPTGSEGSNVDAASRDARQNRHS